MSDDSGKFKIDLDSILGGGTWADMSSDSDDEELSFEINNIAVEGQHLQQQQQPPKKSSRGKKGKRKNNSNSVHSSAQKQSATYAKDIPKVDINSRLVSTHLTALAGEKTISSSLQSRLSKVPTLSTTPPSNPQPQRRSLNSAALKVSQAQITPDRPPSPIRSNKVSAATALGKTLEQEEMRVLHDILLTSLLLFKLISTKASAKSVSVPASSIMWKREFETYNPKGRYILIRFKKPDLKKEYIATLGNYMIGVTLVDIPLIDLRTRTAASLDVSAGRKSIEYLFHLESMAGLLSHSYHQTMCDKHVDLRPLGIFNRDLINFYAQTALSIPEKSAVPDINWDSVGVFAMEGTHSNVKYCIETILNALGLTDSVKIPQPFAFSLYDSICRLQCGITQKDPGSQFEYHSGGFFNFVGMITYTPYSCDTVYPGTDITLMSGGSKTIGIMGMDKRVIAQLLQKKEELIANCSVSIHSIGDYQGSQSDLEWAVTKTSENVDTISKLWTDTKLDGLALLSDSVAKNEGGYRVFMERCLNSLRHGNIGRRQNLPFLRKFINQ